MAVAAAAAAVPEETPCLGGLWAAGARRCFGSNLEAVDDAVAGGIGY